MNVEKITVLKTFFSRTTRMDYLLGRDEAGSLKLFKAYIRQPLKLAMKKDVFESSTSKVINREHFDEAGNKIYSRITELRK